MQNNLISSRTLKNVQNFGQQLFCLIIVSVFCLFLSGCGTGYQKVDGEFTWVTLDAGNGWQYFPIDADETTFQVLECKDYAKDKENVFYRSRRIIDADPMSFRVLTHKQFSRDDNHVFLFGCTIVGADPDSFEILPGLFGKDKNHAFAGTLPIKSADPKTFHSKENSFESYSYCPFTDREYFLERFGMEYADIEVSAERPAIVATGNARDAENHFLKDSARIDQ